MRDQLRHLYIKHPRAFEVWNYLWLFADKNHIVFTYQELSGRFALPRTTVVRYVTQWTKEWNKERVHIELEMMEAVGKYELTFYPNGKKSHAPKDLLIEDCYVWLKGFYHDKQYDYPDLLKHKRFIGFLLSKIEEVMAKRGTEISTETKFQTFQLFFQRLPKWWVENENLNLPVLNKNFTRIINQIKSNSNDKYARTAQQAESIDYSDLAEG